MVRRSRFAAVASVAGSLALTACQLFYSVAVPPDDAGIPGIPDAPAGDLCSHQFTNHETPLTGGSATFFVPNTHEPSRSVWFERSIIVEGPKPGSGAAAFAGSAGQTLSAPRLEPDGLHMLAVQTVPAGNKTNVVEAERMQGGGSTPWGTPVVMTGMPPGVPSTTTADRLTMVLDIGGNQFQVMTRGSADGTMWTGAKPLRAADLGVAAMRQPSLSSDGNRIVFFGTTDGSAKFQDIYKTEKNETGDFALATRLYPAQEGSNLEVTPFLAEDCSILYYSASASLDFVKPD